MGTSQGQGGGAPEKPEELRRRRATTQNLSSGSGDASSADGAEGSASWRTRRRASARHSARRDKKDSTRIRPPSVAEQPAQSETETKDEERGAEPRSKGSASRRDLRRGSSDSGRRGASGEAKPRAKDSARRPGSARLVAEAAADQARGGSARLRAQAPVFVFGPLAVSRPQALKSAVGAAALLLVTWVILEFAREDKRSPAALGPGVAVLSGAEERPNPGPRPKAGAAPTQTRGAARRIPLLTIAGRVLDESGRPVERALVRILHVTQRAGHPDFEAMEREHRVDGEGRFSLELSNRAELLEASASGFATRTVPLVLDNPSALKDLEVVLLGGRLITGQVIEAETGRPIAEARLSGQAGSWQGTTRSDPDGRYRFTNVPNEAIGLFVTAPDRVPAVVEAESDQTIALLEGRSLRGLISDSSGVPVPDAEVLVFGGSHPAVPCLARSDRDGRFRVKGLAPNDEVLIAARAGERITTFDEPWRRPDEAELTVTLVAAGTIILKGIRPEELRLLPILTQPSFDLAEPTTIAGGLQYPGLAPGRYEVEREGRGFGEIITLAPGERVEIEVPEQAPSAPTPEGGEAVAMPQALENGGPIYVVVLDEDGRPISGATVLADSGLAGSRTETARSDGAGRCAIARPSTRIQLSAYMPGRLLVGGVQIEEGKSDATLVLARPARLLGQIRPAMAARIVLIDPALGQAVRELASEPDGRFRLDDLLPGRYTLEVEADGHQTSVLTLQVPVKGDQVSIQLVPGGHHHDIPEASRNQPNDDH